MKRTFFLFIVLCVFSCDNTDVSHVEVFNKFVVGVANSDFKTIDRVSTETTSKIVKQMLEGQRLQRKPLVFSTIVYNVNQTSEIQSNIVIKRDSISSDATKAWVWFEVDGAEEQMVVQLVWRDERWLVDIPVLN